MMRVRILVYVCALMSCDVQTHTAIVKDSDEQSALQEALLLVELLKSEYARVLRENSITKVSEVDEKDLETCAPTTVPTNAVTHTDKPLAHIEQSATSDTLQPHTVHAFRRSYQPSFRDSNVRQQFRRSQQAPASYYHDFPRRRFYNYRDYYGRYGPANSWRRMDYDNIFGPQPGQTVGSNVSQSTTASVTNSSTNTTLSSVLTTASTTASEIPTSSILPNTSSSSTIPLLTTVSANTQKPVTLSSIILKPTEHTLTTILTTLDKKLLKLVSKRTSSFPSAVENKTKQKSKHHAVTEKVKPVQKKLFLVVKETKDTSTNDPEQAQVAAELKNELEVGIGSSDSTISSRRWSLTWRPSTRVHLARSTPYHLPLPENHAFCYTNPESSLCRTFIK